MDIILIIDSLSGGAKRRSYAPGERYAGEHYFCQRKAAEWKKYGKRVHVKIEMANETMINCPSDS